MHTIPAAMQCSGAFYPMQHTRSQLFLATGPIDFLTFQSENYHIVRQSTVSGSCRATGNFVNSTVLTSGPMRIQFHVQDCPGFGGFVYDAYTGFNSVSRIRIEETIPSKHMHATPCVMCLSFTPTDIHDFLSCTCRRRRF